MNEFWAWCKCVMRQHTNWEMTDASPDWKKYVCKECGSPLVVYEKEVKNVERVG